jgi:leucyl aminopeptidase
MRILISPKRTKVDALITPYWKNQVHKKDFEGSEGEILVLYPEKALEARHILLGLGDKKSITAEKLRKAFGQLIKFCDKKKIKSIAVEKPELDDKAFEYAILEALLLPQAKHINHVDLIGKWNEGSIKDLQTVFKGVYFARELINGDAEEVTPAYLVKKAKSLAKGSLKVKSLDPAPLKKMGLIQAVSKGSSLKPAFIIMEYKGNPKSKDQTILIGKGVTYDTGGLNLKSSGMEEMKADMGGAATVIATMSVIEALKLKHNVVALLPCVENAIGPLSMKPGSVYKSYSGKKVEVMNTDAEGRLILADALSYAQKHYQPSRIIDLATLTGAMSIILGPEGIGLFSNDDKLANDLLKAGNETYERCFRLPLIEEYNDLLKSEFGDIKNWNGRVGASILSALFMQAFIDKVKWAHLDIATTTYYLTARKYYPQYASGIGVRLLIQYLRNL